MENGKLYMKPLLIEHSWQTQCKDALKYQWCIGICTLSLSEDFCLEPPPVIHSPFDIPLVLTSYTTTHVIYMSCGDAPMTCSSWLETQAHTSKYLTQSMIALLLCSNYLQWQIFQPQTLTMTLSPRYFGASSCQVPQVTIY